MRQRQIFIGQKTTKSQIWRQHGTSDKTATTAFPMYRPVFPNQSPWTLKGPQTDFEGSVTFVSLR